MQLSDGDDSVESMVDDGMPGRRGPTTSTWGGGVSDGRTRMQLPRPLVMVYRKPTLPYLTVLRDFSWP